ncbi:acyl-CoA dehydrogenase family protein [Novosphingobium taihuense]|uniref:Alkylation response protein AidB-like acyl-CoA dehydrogenase n=1 Tax=Novosphingobium taihuense TaxID=260085 RepID=A0A7W7EUH5_9SPHN|nr:acyl-CoA dehydrogenase family protein [Novosphingobium taihuense]MBB4613921.1 alkylation response protein AidB-like acyl-CoA dehydrogenase [Novosphingobium taihuense]TWH86772.1 alkylation response protein AidB-like acyl-CoA dehydrogenase [Novosphingobium taihuense]
MKLGFSPADEAFRAECAEWLQAEMTGEFADIRGIPNLCDAIPRRKEWEQRLGEAGWGCIGWPREWGGRDATIAQQVIFAEEYARAGAPNRINHIGVELAGPTILAFGSDEQKARYLPEIAAGRQIWCQGYSEPNAGSDLANVKTKARLEDGQWVVNGQKVWTSLAHYSDMIFVVARSEEGSAGPKGLSFLLMDMDQPGIEVRPIRQINGEAEFNETFLTDARCAADAMLGAQGEGWKVAMALLAFERGVSTLGQQMQFRNELDAVIDAAKANGKSSDPVLRQKIARAEIGLRLMRYGALRMLSGTDLAAIDGAALTYKIQWATWRRDLGELGMEVLGQAGEVSASAHYGWPQLPNLFLYARADTIYGGTNQIQRNLIAERGLGLPREPRGSQ